MRASIRRRRMRQRGVRGVICESINYSGPRRWAPCVHLVRFYNSANDIYVCGVHARAFLDNEAVSGAQSESGGQSDG